MNRPQIKTWRLHETTVKQELLDTLTPAFTVETGTQTESNLTFLDDFDRHLWRADYLLCRTDKQTLRLISHSGNSDEISADHDAKFWWQIPAGKIQDTLKNLIDLRAFMPIANLQMHEHFIALRNSDLKLVVRGCFRSCAINAQTHHYFSITALRGYTKEFNAACNAITSLGYESAAYPDLKYLLELHTTFASSHADAESSLTANMPTEQAVRVMARGMLQQACIHVPGIIADIDTEFLHQFRVSFRKLRSLISLLNKSLNTETIEIVKPRLSSISGTTNKLRDLDVFLLEQSYYRALLPTSFASGLDELFTLVEQERVQAQTVLARYFSSTAYTRDLAICTEELLAPASLQTPMSTKPLLPRVKKLLFNRYHKMLAMSTTIHSHTADEEVHELRIEFKKLRYLIEFFNSLLPPKRINKFVSEVKKIQAVFGNFNDYSIQIEFLNTYIDDNRINMSKALSGLIAILHQKKMLERDKVDSVLANFFTPDMNTEIEFLFGENTPGVSQ